MPFVKRSRRSSRRRYAPKRKYVQNRVKKMVGEKVSIVDSIANGVGQVAKLASVVAPIVAAINTEHKYVDVTGSVTTGGGFAGTPSLTLLTPIEQGISDTQRIGNSVLLQDLQVRLAISKTVDNTNTVPSLGTFYRVIIFIWKEDAQENPPTSVKILEDPSNFWSPVNKDYSEQFVILKDWYTPLVANASYSKTDVTGSYVPIYALKKMFRKLGIHARYANDDDTSNTTNHVYMLIGNPGAVDTNTAFYTRVNYTDN